MTAHTVVVGTGYVGRHFMDSFDGPLTGLNRPAFDLDGEPEPPQLETPYRLLYLVPPSRTSLEDVRLERLPKLLEPAPERLVYISTSGVYGNHDGAEVDETTPVNPETDRARRRVSAERLAREYGQSRGCDVVILRVPGIYGPGRLGVERIRDSVPVLREQDTGPGNRIHVEDLVTCCMAALSPDTPAGTYNVGDGDTRSSTWFSREVARQAGLDAPPEISMQQAENEFSPMRLSFLRERRLVNVQKMRDVLGVTPKYANAEDGIAASL